MAWKAYLSEILPYICLPEASDARGLQPASLSGRSCGYAETLHVTIKSNQMPFSVEQSGNLLKVYHPLNKRRPLDALDNLRSIFQCAL